MVCAVQLWMTRSCYCSVPDIWSLFIFFLLQVQEKKASLHFTIYKIYKEHGVPIVSLIILEHCDFPVLWLRGWIPWYMLARSVKKKKVKCLYFLRDQQCKAFLIKYNKSLNSCVCDYTQNNHLHNSKTNTDLPISLGSTLCQIF